MAQKEWWRNRTSVRKQIFSFSLCNAQWCLSSPATSEKLMVWSNDPFGPARHIRKKVEVTRQTTDGPTRNPYRKIDVNENEHSDNESYYPGERSYAEILQSPTYSESTERKSLVRSCVYIRINFSAVSTSVFFEETKRESKQKFITLQF